jgi:hypothetical protein
MQYECMMPFNMLALYVPHQKKNVVKYIWHTYNRWQKRAQQTYSTELTRVSEPAEDGS